MAEETSTTPLRDTADMELSDEAQNEKGQKHLTFGRKISKKAMIICVVLVVLAAIITAVVLGVTLGLKKSKSSGSSATSSPDNDATTSPSSTEPPPLPTAPPNADGPYRNAVVAADSGRCSEIGRDIMEVKKGSAIDAAIATLFCIGVMNMHSAGIGGGGFIVVYNRSNNYTETFDFREEAPAASTENMFVNGSLSSVVGGTASAVPGEVRGFHAVWKKYGRIPWKELVQPSIDLTRDGFQIGENVYYAMTRSSVKPYLFSDPGLRELLVNEAGQMRQKGEFIKMPKLSKTLQRISENPEDFYTGQLAQDIVSELRKAGGLITMADMRNYRVKIKKTLVGTLGEYQWYSMPPPGSGCVVGLILNILKGYKMNADSMKGTNNSILTFHRITEAFKFAYAYRALLGDPDFVDLTQVLRNISDPQFGEHLRHRIYDNMTFTEYRYYGDYYSSQGGGTSHMSLMAPNGDAVSATTTINLFFGSKFRGPKTGILYNNEMDDFSIPNKKNAFGVLPSPANFVKPGKRPLSSMAPSIFVDKNGDVRMVSGASGGTKITTAVALSVMNYLWFNRTLAESVTDPRIHHQLMPMYIRVDRDYPIPQAIIEGLEQLGHDVRKRSSFAVVQATARDKDGLLYGKSDPRKGGWAAGY